MIHSENPGTEEDFAIEEKIRKYYATVNPLRLRVLPKFEF